MDELLLAVMRAAHGLTAAVWVGISLVGVLSPAGLAAARADGRVSLRSQAQFSIWALVVTGAVLMLDRLSDPRVSALYVVLLGTKLALVAVMGLLAVVVPAPTPDGGAVETARDLRGGRGAARWSAGWRRPLSRAARERVLLALGLGAYVLGSLLTSAYEAGLRGS